MPKFDDLKKIITSCCTAIETSEAWCNPVDDNKCAASMSKKMSQNNGVKRYH